MNKIEFTSISLTGSGRVTDFSCWIPKADKPVNLVLTDGKLFFNGSLVAGTSPNLFSFKGKTCDCICGELEKEARVFLDYALQEMADTARSEALDGITKLKNTLARHFEYRGAMNGIDVYGKVEMDNKIDALIDQLKAHTGQEDCISCNCHCHCGDVDHSPMVHQIRTCKHCTGQCVWTFPISNRGGLSKRLC